MEQISYVSRYTRSRKQRSFCVTVKYTGFGCAGVGETNNNRMTGSPSNQLFGFYSNGITNDWNSYNSFGPCTRRSSKLSNGFFPSLVSFCSTSTSPPFPWSSYKTLRTKYETVLVLIGNPRRKRYSSTNKQMDLIMRQGVSSQRVIIDLEEETETLKEELRTSTTSSTIKKHTEYLVETQDAQLYKMLHEVFHALHRKRSTWTLTTPIDMPEMCKRQ